MRRTNRTLPPAEAGLGNLKAARRMRWEEGGRTWGDVCRHGAAFWNVSVSGAERPRALGDGSGGRFREHVRSTSLSIRNPQDEAGVV